MNTLETPQLGQGPAANIHDEDLHLILSILDGESPPTNEYDGLSWHRCYRAGGIVFPDSGGVCSLCVHDMAPGALEFISRRALPVGKVGRLYVRAADKKMLQVLGTVSKCNEFAPGWYEGSMVYQEEHDTGGVVQGAGSHRRPADGAAANRTP